MICVAMCLLHCSMAALMQLKRVACHAVTSRSAVGSAALCSLALTLRRLGCRWVLVSYFVCCAVLLFNWPADCAFDFQLLYGRWSISIRAAMLRSVAVQAGRSYFALYVFLYGRSLGGGNWYLTFVIPAAYRMRIVSCHGLVRELPIAHICCSSELHVQLFCEWRSNNP